MSAQNIKLGTCQVTFDSVDLGMTMGGVEVEISTETHDTQVDQHGTTFVDQTILGRSIVARVPMVESTLDNLLVAIPGATLIEDGIDPTIKYLSVPHAVGTSLRDAAASLQLRPSANVAGANPAEDVIIPLASPAGNVTFMFKHDEERVYMAEFRGYPDLDTGLMFTVGDVTATP